MVFIGTVIPFERSKIDAPGPCVLFATPGMLSGGLSLEVFKHWAPSESNMIILPGWVTFSKLFHFCVCMGETAGNQRSLKLRDLDHGKVGLTSEVW